MKHTERGTCQVCGAVQAFTSRRVLAKHGYTVNYGFFNGTCRGSGEQPLELDHKITTDTIEWLRNVVAPNAEKRVADLISKAVSPTWYRLSFAEHVEARQDELSPSEQERQIGEAVYKAKQTAAQAKQHATMLEELIASRHGQSLYPVEREERKVVQEGVKVDLWGHTGTVTEVKHKAATGMGPFLNGKVIPFATVQWEDGSLQSVAVRSIRQKSIIG